VARVFPHTRAAKPATRVEGFFSGTELLPSSTILGAENSLLLNAAFAGVAEAFLGDFPTRPSWA
jgi:hypothetical protein